MYASAASGSKPERLGTSKCFPACPPKADLRSARLIVYASVQARMGIALRVDGTQTMQLSASCRELLAQFGHVVLQPALSGHQFRAALADDGARRAKRGSSNAWRLKPNSRRSAGASTSTR